MDHSRITFFILGMFLLLMSGFLVFVSFMAHAKPVSIVYMLLAMSIMSFCLSYLYPQFKQKDERMKLIRQKGMFASFFAMVFYLICFNLGLQFEFFAMTASQVVQLLSALMICTIFISFVVYSKIY